MGVKIAEFTSIKHLLAKALQNEFTTNSTLYDSYENSAAGEIFDEAGIESINRAEPPLWALQALARIINYQALPILGTLSEETRKVITADYERTLAKLKEKAQTVETGSTGDNVELANYGAITGGKAL